MCELLDGVVRRLVQRSIFVGAGYSPFDEGRAAFAYREHLRTPVETQVKESRTGWTGLQLAIDVAQVGATHDEDGRAGGTEGFETRSQRTGIGLAVRDRRAVPIEDERLERPVEKLGA